MKEVNSINEQLDTRKHPITEEEAKEIAKEETGKDLSGDELKEYTD